MMMLDNTNIKKVLHVQLTMKMIEMGKMLRRAMNIFFILAVLSIGIAVAVYGIKSSKEEKAGLSFDNDHDCRFGWSFWVGAGAAVMALLTSLLYGCSSKNED